MASRHIVCLTFDFDTMSGFMARGLTTPTFLSRGEFGLVGAGRILALLDAFAIKATWFIPGFTLESFPHVCESVVRGGHEVGHHGWTHAPPASLSREQEEADLVRANESIERLTGQCAFGYRSPSWDLSEHTLELLLAHSFAYDSSLMGNDYSPYLVRRSDLCKFGEPFQLGPQTQLVEIPVSWSLDDFPHFEYLRTGTTIMPGLQSAELVMNNWIDEFVYMTKTVNWGVLTYTCHPYVIGRGYRMLHFERFVTRLAEKGAHFMTMHDAVNEAKEHGLLTT